MLMSLEASVNIECLGLVTSDSAFSYHRQGLNRCDDRCPQAR